MRRCPHCQAPDPDEARFCLHCGRPLEPPVRRPRLSLDDLWSPEALGRCAVAALPVMAFALSATPWLAGGPGRDEARVLSYHLAHGLLLAAGLAWARRERSPLAWGGWLLAGLAGGALSEALDLWFSYRQFFSGLALWLWAALGLADRPPLVYEILQGLRLLGAALPLGLAYAFQERRPARWLQAPLWVGLALAARSQVRGAWLLWAAVGLPSAQGAGAWALFYASVLALLWGLGPRGRKAPGKA